MNKALTIPLIYYLSNFDSTGQILNGLGLSCLPVAIYQEVADLYNKF